MLIIFLTLYSGGDRNLTVLDAGLTLKLTVSNSALRQPGELQAGKLFRNMEPFWPA